MRRAFVRRNLGHTSSRSSRPASSVMIRSRVNPNGKYPAYSTLSAPRYYPDAVVRYANTRGAKPLVE